jgi:hypothetical protein
VNAAKNRRFAHDDVDPAAFFLHPRAIVIPGCCASKKTQDMQSQTAFRAVPVLAR